MARNPPALAKITQPRLHDVLARHRLFEALDGALRRPVVWLSAQPGAGKTTLVASYLQAQPAKKRRCLWYQVDDGDADPASFIYHLRLAARGHAPEATAAALPLLTPEYLADLRGFARRFFRAFFGMLEVGDVLVLDNLQEAGDAVGFHRVVAEAIAQLPDGMHLIVISRADPDGIYAPLLAAGAIALVDGEALRLTVEETRAIAERSGSAADVQALHLQSQGWAAGLTLLLTPTRRGAAAATDDAESLQHVFGYFAQRVFDDCAAEQQQALMQLALLPQMPADLLEPLTGHAGCERLLDGYYRHHLFTDRRRVRRAAAGGAAQGSGVVYQFHALFRSFLLHQARGRFAADAWRDVVARAGRLLDGAGQHEQALALFAEASDWRAYAGGVLSQAQALLDQGRHQTLAEAIARLPAAERERCAWVGYWEGRAWMHTQPERAVQLLQQQHDRCLRDGDVACQLACGAALVQTLWYARLGWSEIIRWVDRLEPLMAAQPVLPTPAVQLLTESALHAALSFCRLSHPEIGRLGRRLLALIDDEGIDWNQRLLAATHLITWFHNAAELDLANQLIAKVDAVVDQRPSSALNRSFWFTFRAIHDMRQARDDVAAELFDRAETLARDDGLVHAEYAAMQFHTYLDILFRRTEAARARVQRMETHAARGRPDAEMNYHTSLTFLAEQQGRSAEALAHARRALQAIERVGAGYFQVVYALSLVSAFAQGGEQDLAMSLIARARDIARGTYLEYIEGELLLEEGFVAWSQGDLPRLHDRLRKGLARAVADRKQAAFVHRIVARRPELLVAALRAGIEVDLVRELIRRWRLPPPPEEIASWPWPVKVRTLGGFEVRVHDAPIAFGRKAPKKTLALLKAVVARGGSAPEGALIDLFWPDEEGDAAAKSLGAAVHRLRQLLGGSEVVVQLGGQVSLDRERVWADAWSFERGVTSTEPQAVLDALALYQGAFLAEEEGESWPVATRERLRGRFVHAVADHALRLEAAGRDEEAIAWYFKGLDADSVVEPFYQGLMRCYHRLDRLPEAVSAYRRLKQILSVTLSLPPSAATEKLYQSLRPA